MDDLAMVLKAMGDPTRWRLLSLLHERGEMCVCELLDEVEGTQSNLSMHLRLLHNAGLVRREKVGKFVFYSLDPAVVEELLTALRAGLDPATAGADRPADAIYSVCCGPNVPLSRAEAEDVSARCCAKES